jgi:hypothetical protein
MDTITLVAGANRGLGPGGAPVAGGRLLPSRPALGVISRTVNQYLLLSGDIGLLRIRPIDIVFSMK